MERSVPHIFQRSAARCGARGLAVSSCPTSSKQGSGAPRARNSRAARRGGSLSRDSRLARSTARSLARRPALQTPPRFLTCCAVAGAACPSPAGSLRPVITAGRGSRASHMALTRAPSQTDCSFPLSTPEKMRPVPASSRPVHLQLSRLKPLDLASDKTTRIASREFEIYGSAAAVCFWANINIISFAVRIGDCKEKALCCALLSPSLPIPKQIINAIVLDEPLEMLNDFRSHSL